MLITPQNVICFEGDDFDIESKDINAILHLISSKFMMEGVDYFMPYCIPSISDQGYVNIYFRFLTKEIGLVLICSDSKKIAESVQICQKVEIVIKNENMMSVIKDSIKKAPRIIKDQKWKKARYVMILNQKLNQY